MTSPGAGPPPWRSPTCTPPIVRSCSVDSSPTLRRRCAWRRSTPWHRTMPVSQSSSSAPSMNRRTVDAALDASRRLGTPAIASAANRLSMPGPIDQPLVRLVAASDATQPGVHSVVAALVTHPDRSVSIAALGAIARAGATVEAHVLDELLGQDAGHSARVLAASTTMTDGDAMLLRALDDELQVARAESSGGARRSPRRGPDRRCAPCAQQPRRSAPGARCRDAAGLAQPQRSGARRPGRAR